MTDYERAELEVCIDVLNSLVAEFYNITSRHNISLDADTNTGAYYRKMLKYVQHLRKATSYDEVLTARSNIATIREKLVKLEVNNYV